MRQTRFVLHSFVFINLLLYVVFSYTEYSSYYSVKPYSMCANVFSVLIPQTFFFCFCTSGVRSDGM